LTWPLLPCSMSVRWKLIYFQTDSIYLSTLYILIDGCQRHILPCSVVTLPVVCAWILERFAFVYRCCGQLRVESCLPWAPCPCSELVSIASDRRFHSAATDRRLSGPRSPFIVCRSSSSLELLVCICCVFRSMNDYFNLTFVAWFLPLLWYCHVAISRVTRSFGFPAIQLTRSVVHPSLLLSLHALCPADRNETSLSDKISVLAAAAAVLIIVKQRCRRRDQRFSVAYDIGSGQLIVNLIWRNRLFHFISNDSMPIDATSFHGILRMTPEVFNELSEM